MASDAFIASEQKLAAAHEALRRTRGLQLDFKAVPPQPEPPAWLDGFLHFLAGLAPILKFLFWGGVILAVALVAWFVVREVLETRFRKVGAAAPPADWRPGGEQARALLEEADALAAVGRFGEAIHILLFRTIEDLAGRRPGLVRPALTSRDIAGLEQMPGPARKAFGRIAERVERSVFGGRPVDQQDFAHARGDYEAFAFSGGLVVSAAASIAASVPAFAPRTILALVAVGLVSFAGLAVLAAYAPELRGATDPGAHALSSSAVGFRGATVMLRAEGVPVVVSRAEPRGRPGGDTLTVLTPPFAADLKPFAQYANLLIVLPKWVVAPQPLHPGFVQKYGNAETSAYATELLAPYARKTQIEVRRKGDSQPALRGAGALFDAGTYLPLGPIDRFQTVSGPEWEPMLVDEQGRAVLARLRKRPGVVVLADPDLLNNQGLAKLDNARAGMAVLNGLRGESGVRFDVTVNGFTRGDSVGRLMLEPPWLAATLCGVAAALLMGLHGLARFGPTLTRGRAIALGKSALVDNSAGLVRMARREAELAPAYAALTKALVSKVAGGRGRAAVGGDNDHWLADLSRRSGAADPAALTAQAEQAKTRDDLLAVGRNLYHWRLEITRERR